MPQVNAKHTFVAGQYDSYMYEWTTDLWYELPRMSFVSYATACTLYNDGDGEVFIIAAG